MDRRNDTAQPKGSSGLYQEKVRTDPAPADSAYAGGSVVRFDSRLCGSGSRIDVKGENVKKREELEAIVDQLHEWCLKYGEGYASVSIVDNIGLAAIGTNQPDYAAMSIYKNYTKEPAGGNRTGSGR